MSSIQDLYSKDNFNLDNFNDKRLINMVLDAGQSQGLKEVYVLELDRRYSQRNYKASMIAAIVSPIIVILVELIRLIFG